MLNNKFIAIQSKREYLVIERHRIFKDVWRCYPVDKLPAPYKQVYIDCFGEDFIKESLSTDKT